MTFYEAAVEVLRRSGRPLHYKKITEIAVRENLLSHVGKTPHLTMSNRLEKEVEKNSKSPIGQTRPGVFELDAEQAKDLTKKLAKKRREEEERRAQREKEQQKRKRTKSNDDQKNGQRQKSRDSGSSQSKSNQKNNQKQSRSKSKGNQKSKSNGSDPKRRRSRGSKKDATPKTRKKDRSGRDRSSRSRKSGKSKQATKSSKSSDSNKRRRRRRSRDDDGGGKSAQKSDSQRSGNQKKSRSKSSKSDSSSQQKSSNRKRRRRRGGNDDESSESQPTTVSEQAHLEEGPVRLKGIPKAAYKVLSERDNQAMPIDQLADEIFDRKMVKFHTHEPVTTVKSALSNDNQIRNQRGHRPLFACDDSGHWWLTEWDLAGEIHAKEQAILSLTEEIRQASIDQLGNALLDVQPEALEHLALTLLERLGYYNIKVSKRSSNGDVFFTADWRQGLADVRVCVRVVTDHSRSLGQEDVESLRETLNHYSASEGVIIHLGSISGNAVGKARIDGQAPITLLDEDTFVELLIKHGIGVKMYESPIVTVDTDFIDALAE